MAAGRQGYGGAAVFVNREKLAYWTHRIMPLEWSSVQTHLGNSLSILGKHVNKTIPLDRSHGNHASCVALMAERTRVYLAETDPV